MNRTWDPDRYGNPMAKKGAAQIPVPATELGKVTKSTQADKEVQGEIQTIRTSDSNTTRVSESLESGLSRGPSLKREQSFVVPAHAEYTPVELPTTMSTAVQHKTDDNMQSTEPHRIAVTQAPNTSSLTQVATNSGQSQLQTNRWYVPDTHAQTTALESVHVGISKPPPPNRRSATLAPARPARGKPSAPDTYHTVKLQGETPEQTLARIQGMKQLEIAIDQLNKDEESTAAVGTLKLLRMQECGEEPTSTDSPIQQATISTPALSGLDPNMSLRGGTGSGSMLKEVKVGARVNTGPRVSIDQRPAARKSQWVRNSDTKAHREEFDSNACGSEASSGNNSLDHMGMGRLIRLTKPLVQDSPIVGYDNKFNPPPLDWEHRPHFNNNNENRQYFIEGFNRWLLNTVTLTFKHDVNMDFRPLGVEQVTDVNNHPDGLGFVPKETTIGPQNGEHYGYEFHNDTFYSSRNDMADFDTEYKVDMSIPNNIKYRDETTQTLIRRKEHLVRKTQQRNSTYVQGKTAARDMTGNKALAESAISTVNDTTWPPACAPDETTRPKTNMYLRPAVLTDIPGMTEVYNWHIENGVRASELHPISCDDMQLRFNMVKDSRMPFIVAVEKSRGSARQRKTRRVYGMNHHGDYNDPDNTTLTKEEHVIGWASATEWSCADYVECISAEVELYVAHDFRQKGVGRALMDVLLDATDSGHTKVGNYDFRVAPEIAHKYNGGGIRNLHKIIFTVRAWNKPMAPENCYRTYKTTTRANLDKWSNWNAAPDAGASHHHITNPIKDFSKEARLSDREDDYSVWLKEWLESYGFEEEGGFKKIGTRNRRFIDIHYFTKETHWQPVENQMEDYSIGPV